MTQDMLTLGFDHIIVQLQNEAVSQSAKELLARTAPILNENLCRARMEETTAARRVLEASGTPPLALMNGLEASLTLAIQGGMLTPDQLTEGARFASTARRLQRYLLNAAITSAVISSWHTELPDLSELEDSIDRCIREDALLDDASPALRSLRRSRERLEGSIREKLEQAMQRHKQYLSDAYVTQRSGCYVLPVQRRFQSVFPGRVVDASAKGGTVFMEPSSVAAAQQELDALIIELDAEERRILYELSDLLAVHEAAIRKAMRVMTDLDVLFARARLSAAMNARPVTLTADRQLVLIDARHPLVENCVPLDLRLEAPDLGVAVTGPNTGGKTVCLKTVGLLCMMAQSGLHIPCGEGSVIPLTDGIYSDIGDSQSISQSLSTFSGHMTNIIRILQACSRDSLVLLDEPGSGTDPAEGTGLATAILEELLHRRCFFLTTTHDPQIKQWAEQTKDVISARMAFDRRSLQPLYRLELGLSGESCAIEIARRLGMDEYLLKRARQVADCGPSPSDAPPHMHSIPHSRLQRAKVQQTGDYQRFTMGDSVALLPERKPAIVYQPADDEGNVIIQLQEQKLTVKHTRLQLIAPASELYPPDYDFSIIFDTVANRKAAHQMSRKFDPEAVIIHREGI